MGIDARHDHSLRIPRPDQSVTLGTPNACNACHAERAAKWAAAAVARWYPEHKPGFQGFAEAFAAADRGDPSSVESLLTLIGDPAQPAIVRASAIARAEAFLSPAVVEALKRPLADPDALVRAAAAEALAGADAGLRAEQLTPLLHDPVRLVRMAAARALAGAPERRLLPDERGKFTSALDEWSAGQRYNADRPESLTNLGTLHFERGATQEAIASFRAALERDPTFHQAAVNLADVHRSLGDDASAEQTLREAVARGPGTAVAHHALGLTLIREGHKAEALTEFKAAHALDERNARFAYVYAVALHDSGDPVGAVAMLRKAVGLHPYDRDLLAALAAYEGKGP
jgi:tetratricopeptide (TPR) repeat protein